MTAKHTRLELTWIGKDERPRLEPRILLEDPELSYHAEKRVSDNDIFDNLLVHGDNLLALRALEQRFAGGIKCVYIDPPYNTGQAFETYDDGIEHSIWLGLIRERLEIIRRLLSQDGVIFVQLNDDECAYCKVLMDEIFGRGNFINQVSLKTKHTAGASGGGEDKKLKKNIEYLLIYAKDLSTEQGFRKFNECFEETDLFDLIDEMVADGKSWKYTSILLDKGTFMEERVVLDGSGQAIKVRKYKGGRRTTVQALMRKGHSREAVYLNHFEDVFSDTNAQTSIRTRIIEEFLELEADELLEAEYVPRSGRDAGRVVQHLYISPTIRRVIWLKDTAKRKGSKLIKLDKLGTFWSGFNWNNVNKEGGVVFDGGKKPEALVRQIIELCTEPGDWVLDSFLGSGTTAAVAHKLGRKWIGIELRDHCKTLCVPRLRRVIAGNDNGGITGSTKWSGGGGFRFYELAPSLLEKDKWGNWVVSKQYNPEMLAEAMCKLEGFRYAPDPDVFWIHGQSTETDLIYVTTQNLSQEQLQFISDQVGDERTLLICCSAFRAKPYKFANLTLKKIPQAVLHRCEWCRDDYSLNVNALPDPEPEPDAGNEDSAVAIASTDDTAAVETPRPATKRGRPRRRGATMQELPLFATLDQGGDA
jgi:adenine-specific DNA-methyltransferase